MTTTAAPAHLPPSQELRSEPLSSARDSQTESGNPNRCGRIAQWRRHRCSFPPLNRCLTRSRAAAATRICMTQNSVPVGCRLFLWICTGRDFPTQSRTVCSAPMFSCECKVCRLHNSTHPHRAQMVAITFSMFDGFQHLAVRKLETAEN